uniref:Candidate secreted effector n=1 Tax=Meloidogyne incognita TaxID=6306 RepID=A0A914P1G8_MELIC
MEGEEGEEGEEEFDERVELIAANVDEDGEIDVGGPMDMIGPHPEPPPAVIDEAEEAPIPLAVLGEAQGNGGDGDGEDEEDDDVRTLAGDIELQEPIDEEPGDPPRASSSRNSRGEGGHPVPSPYLARCRGLGGVGYPLL